MTQTRGGRAAMNRRRRFLLRLTFIVAATGCVRGDEIDDYVKAAMADLHIPGVAIAVIKDGSTIKAEGYGLADLEQDIPVRPHTVFKIGSVSKQFIAVGIMLLVQDGKVSLDDRVRKYIPGAPETWEAITLRHLLTHTSGIVREAPGFNPYKVQTEIEVIQSAYPAPLRFAPGEKWEYCNVGYFALAEVINKASGKPWGDFLAERVFAPLGMTATRATTVTDLIPHRAKGYDWKADKFYNMPDWPAVRPSGAFLSTVLDLAKWEAALLTDQILPGTAKTAMWTPVLLNGGATYPYGLGWQLDGWPADSREPARVPMIRHGGSLPGFRASYSRWPNQGLAVIVLTNLEGPSVDALAAEIAVRALPELRSIPLARPEPAPK